MGYKPTINTHSADGIKPLAGSLDTLGYVTRRVDDLRLMREVFLGKEAALPLQQSPRIAMCRTPFWAEMTADGAAQFLATIDFLASNGFEVEELSIPNEFESLRHTHQRLMAFEVARNHVPEYAYENHHKLGELTLQVFAEGWSVSTEEYFVRRSEVTRARREFNQLSSAYDVVLVPFRARHRTEDSSDRQSHLQSALVPLGDPCDHPT